MSKVLAISCTHFPFEHKESNRFLGRVLDEHQPDTILHLGDLVDHHVISLHERETDAKGARDEARLARRSVSRLSEALGNHPLTVLPGNHDLSRIRRVAAKGGITADWLKSMADIYDYPNNWTDYTSESIIIDDTLYLHGTSAGEWAFNYAKEYGMNVVGGHIHQAFGVRYKANPMKIIFGCHVGTLADTHAYAMRYGAHTKNRPILGCAVITGGKHVNVIPMPLS